MNTSLSSPENQEEREQLFQIYKERHTNFHTWSIVWWLITLPARFAKKDPYRSLPGMILMGVGVILVLLIPLLVVSSLTGSWNDAEMPIGIGVTVSYGVIVAVTVPLTVRADEDLLSLHSSIATVQGLRRLIAWDRRWFSYPVEYTLSLLFTLFTLLVFLAIHRATGNYPIPISTTIIGLYLFFSVGTTAADLILLGCETPLLLREEFLVFRFNPAQTLAFQRALHGYNGMASIISLVVTIGILLSALMLPRAFGLVLPITLLLLGLAYSSIILTVVIPRFLISEIIRNATERELAILQERIDTLWPRLPQLSKNEMKDLERLEKDHERLINTPNNLINLGQAVSTLLRTIFLPTLSTIISFLFTNVIIK